ncbi:MAG: ABC transporter permease [Desulfurococcales archaeon]|nr:ABC transporter permease [Desulfurococcales archaeon]
MKPGDLAGRIASEVVLVTIALLIGLASIVIVATYTGAPATGMLKTMLLSWEKLPDMVAEYTAVLTLTAMAFSIPLYAGLFNIGAEGSLYIGALAALWTAIETGNLLLSLIVGVLTGLLLTGFAGILRVYLNVNEVLSTIMLNWIVYWTLLYAIIVYLADPVYPQRTIQVPPQARLPHIGGIPLTILVSALTSILMFVFIRMTRQGILLRFSGANENACRERGVNTRYYRILSMLLAGGLAGLAGSIHILGYSYSIDVLGGTVRGYGFNGIGVALMGRNDPLGILLASFLFSTLLAGSQLVEPLYGVPKEAADTAIGIIVIALAAPEAFRIIYRRVKGWK